MIKVFLMAEEAEPEAVAEFATQAEADAFRDGYARGCEMYGAGWGGTYTEDDLPELDASDERRDRKTAAAIRRLLAKGE